MTTITIAIIIMVIVAVLFNKNFSAVWNEHVIATCTDPHECFECNEGSCVGCPVLLDTVGPKMAYITLAYFNKVVATCTITFKGGCVVAQQPPYVEGVGHRIPNLVGYDRTKVSQWLTDEEEGCPRHMVTL